jgi:hypothetical protein
MNDNDALSGTRYALVSVQDGRLLDDLSINETFATEDEAVAEADDPCTSIAGSERALQPGEGYWIFEIRPVRFVGRTR